MSEVKINSNCSSQDHWGLYQNLIERDSEREMKLAAWTYECVCVCVRVRVCMYQIVQDSSHSHGIKDPVLYYQCHMHIEKGKASIILLRLPY